MRKFAKYSYGRLKTQKNFFISNKASNNYLDVIWLTASTIPFVFG